MSEETSGQTQTPWYKTGRGILIAVISGFILLLIAAGQKSSATNTGQVAGTSVESTPSSITGQQKNTGLSNDNYYTNVDGNRVHSPAYSNTIPEEQRLCAATAPTALANTEGGLVHTMVGLLSGYN